MRKFGKKLAGILAAVVLVAALPVAAGAVNIQGGAPSVTVNTTTIAFAGHEWYVVAGNSNATFGTDAKSVTLLLKTPAGFGTYASAKFNENSFGVYKDGPLHTAMQDISVEIQMKNVLEYDLIASRTLTDVPSGGVVSGTDHKVWPLSTDEANNINNTTVLGYSDRWWLRSPSAGGAANVSASGGVDGHGLNSGSALRVRPALNLDLSTVLFTSDASGAGAKSSVAEGSWSAAVNPTTGAIKLTLPDSGLQLASATVAGVSGNTITFSYNAAGSTSSFNRLSAIVTDSTGAVKYYGNLQHTPATTGSASVTVPGGLAATDKLLVFVEQVSADSDNMSDFAGSPMELPYSTQAAPTGLAGTAPTTTGGTDGQITGTTTDMEYRADNGVTWTDCMGGTTTGLTAGSYQVRYKAQTVNGIEAVLASPAAPVNVGMPTYAQADSNSLTLSRSTVKVGEEITVTAAGHLQDAAGTEIDDTRFWPISWSVNPSGSFPPNGPYTATFKLDTVGTHTLTVTYRLERWYDNTWNDTGERDIKTATITVQAAGASGGGSPQTGDAGASGGGSPQTGDNSNMGLWLALLVLVLLALATGCRVLYRRRKAG